MEFYEIHGDYEPVTEEREKRSEGLLEAIHYFRQVASTDGDGASVFYLRQERLKQSAARFQIGLAEVKRIAENVCRALDRSRTAPLTGQEMLELMGDLTWVKAWCDGEKWDPNDE